MVSSLLEFMYIGLYCLTGARKIWGAKFSEQMLRPIHTIETRKFLAMKRKLTETPHDPNPKKWKSDAMAVAFATFQQGRLDHLVLFYLQSVRDYVNYAMVNKKARANASDPKTLTQFLQYRGLWTDTLPEDYFQPDNPHVLSNYLLLDRFLKRRNELW